MLLGQNGEAQNFCFVFADDLQMHKIYFHLQHSTAALASALQLMPHNVAHAFTNCAWVCGCAANKAANILMILVDLLQSCGLIVVANNKRKLAVCVCGRSVSVLWCLCGIAFVCVCVCLVACRK